MIANLMSLLIIFLIIFSLFYIPLFLFIIYLLYATISAAPFVPTRSGNVSKMIALANLTGVEKVIDLGSGEGRIVFAAAPRCKEITGVEINPLLYLISRLKQLKAGHKNIFFVRNSLWKINLALYDVVFIYFIPHKMQKLAEKIKIEMKPGSRVVSYAFTFPDWPVVKKDGSIYLYTTPCVIPSRR